LEGETEEEYLWCIKQTIIWKNRLEAKHVIR